MTSPIASVASFDGARARRGLAPLERAGFAASPSPMPRRCREMIEDAARAGVGRLKTTDRGGDLSSCALARGGAVLGARSLVLGYASPGGTKAARVLRSPRREGAARLNETARFVQAVCRPSGMRPFAEGWQITLKVRLIHAQVRKMLPRARRGLGRRGSRRISTTSRGPRSSSPASIIDGLRKLGLKISHEEAGGVHSPVALGRSRDRCPARHPAWLRPEAMRLADLIELTMGEPDQDSHDLTKALFQSGDRGGTHEGGARAAHRSSRFGMVICRELVGDDLADKLAVLASRRATRCRSSSARGRGGARLARRPLRRAGAPSWWAPTTGTASSRSASRARPTSFRSPRPSAIWRPSHDPRLPSQFGSDPRSRFMQRLAVLGFSAITLVSGCTRNERPTPAPPVAAASAASANVLRRAGGREPEDGRRQESRGGARFGPGARREEGRAAVRLALPIASAA